MKLRSSLKRGLLLVTTIVLLTIQCSLSVTIYSAPQDFDSFKDYSSVVVAGSVVQLFCSASGQFTAPNIHWTWNNITIPETAQLPHLMVKSWTVNNSLLTATVLIINGFTETDNGSYRCLAQEAGDSVGSTQLLLTAINSSNVLKIIRELNNNIGPDRTSVPLGSSAISTNGSFLRCSAEQPGPSSLAAPSMIWLKDGTQLSGDGVRVLITTTNFTVGTSNRTTSFVRIFNFSQSDAGVYQCVFYDTPSQGGEVITTRPYKVDTGPIRLTAISPSAITFCPPEPLVIEVDAGGEYAGILWTRTPVALNLINNQLVDFDQTFLMTTPSVYDAGLYQVILVPTNLGLRNISINFNIYLGTAKPPSTTIAPNMITSEPGMSVSITCTSIGYPPPNITWYYQPAYSSSSYGPLPPTVIVAQSTQVSSGVCSSWNVSSTLTITNASSSIHQGVYLCTGTNKFDGNVASSNAHSTFMITKEISNSTMASPSSQTYSSDSLLTVTVIVSVISAVIIVALVIGLIFVMVQLRKKNCTSTTKQGFNNVTTMEMMSTDVTIVPKSQETPGYSRLFQGTPFYHKTRGRNALNAQSVPSLAVHHDNELRESKSSSSFMDTPLPRGYEKPVSSTESVCSRTGAHSALHQAGSSATDSSLKVPAVPIYTHEEQDEDFVTVDQLNEMNQKRQRGGTYLHQYVEQATSPSTRQLLTAIDADN